MTDQCELHTQKAQVYATERSPGYPGRAPEESGVSVQQTRVIPHNKVLSYPWLSRQRRHQPPSSSVSCRLPGGRNYALLLLSILNP